MQIELGACRARIAQQTVVQSLVLAFLGGAGALATSLLTTRGTLRMAFRSIKSIPVSPWSSFAVLAFAFAVSILTGLAFGAAPAQFAARTQPSQPYRGAMRISGDNHLDSSDYVQPGNSASEFTLG